MRADVRKGRLKKLKAAFICWCKEYDQYSDASWRRQKGSPQQLAQDIVIDRGDIPDLLNDPDFADATNLWVDFKAFGASYGGGYMEWPCQVYDVVKCFDGLYAEHKLK